MSNLITICIPTYARPSLLLHALHSCFIQDYRPLEIDISDDSKTDDTKRLVESLGVPPGIQLRYNLNPTSLGQAANVNQLFALASGERLILLHDDDALLPGAVSALANALDESASAIAAYGMQHVILDNGVRSPRDTEIHSTDGKRLPSCVGLSATPLTRALWRQFPNNGYLVYSRLAREIGYRALDIVGEACDLDFSVRLAQEYNHLEFLFIDRFTSEYRLTSGSLRTTPQTGLKFFQIVENLKDLSPEEEAARARLLRKIAHRAVAENALQGRRREAIRIFLTKAYSPTENLLKAIYHLGLIAVPQLGHLRRSLPYPIYGNRD